MRLEKSIPPAVLPARQSDVIILGAGAAGLLCALTAARRGRRVLLLERSNKVGKKILMSGGGRCNFTNLVVEPDNFISDNPHFCISALNRYTQWDFIAMVEKHGVEYEERRHGQLFCLHSAGDILAMLLSECKAAGVSVHTHCDISTIETLDEKAGADRFRLRGTLGAGKSKMPVDLRSESLVIATGALSIPSLGGSGMAYDIAKQFGLPVTERRAGLVPFMFSDAFKPICERLSGLSTAVAVSCNEQTFEESMLFTHRGLSGPVILQISSYWHPGDPVRINLLPDTDAIEWLLESKLEQGKLRLNTVLQSRLAKALVAELERLWWPELAGAPLAEFSNKKLSALGAQLNSWHLKPSATEGYRTAEVTLGGVDTSSISSKSMETKELPGLYFIGEALDVSGHLGGFNFQWAWSSGYSAGMFA